MADARTLIYGTLVLALITCQIVSAVLFKKDRHNSKRIIFFTASTTVFVFTVLLVILLQTGVGFFLCGFTALSLLGIPAFIIDRIITGTYRPLFKAALTVPVTVFSCYLLIIGVGLLDIVVWGGAWP